MHNAETYNTLLKACMNFHNRRDFLAEREREINDLFASEELEETTFKLSSCVIAG